MWAWPGGRESARARFAREHALRRRGRRHAAALAVPAARSINTSFHEGRCGEAALVLQGKLGRRGFRGRVWLGPCDPGGALHYSRAADGRLAHQCGDIHLLHAALSDAAATRAAIEGFAPQLGSLTVSASGLALEYAPVSFESLAQDLRAGMELLSALAQLPDPELLAAVKRQDRAAVEALLRGGAEPLAAGPRDRDFVTRQRYPWRMVELPILVALDLGRLDLLELLARARPLPAQVLYLALRLAIHRHDAPALRVLLDGSGVDPAGWTCRSLLRESMERGFLDGLRQLLERGAWDPDLRPAGTADYKQVGALLETARLRRVDAIGPVALAQEFEARRSSAPRRLTAALLRSLFGRFRPRPLAARAAALGLSVTGSDGSAVTLGGEQRGHQVFVDITGYEEPSESVRLRVAGIPSWLGLRKEPLLDRMGFGSTGGGADVETADWTFDRRIEVAGPRPGVMALLSGSVRQKALIWVDGMGGRIAAGWVEIERNGVLDPEHLRHLIEAALDLAQDLAERDRRGTLACLSEGAREGIPATRNAMIEALASEHPGSPELLAAARFALSSDNDWLRVSAARHLGEEGTELLRDVLADTKLYAGLRGQALWHLGERLGTGGEELVLRWLESGEMPIRLAAARVLGERCGTARSIEPLIALAGTRGEMGRAARAALAQVRARRSGIEPGRLTIAAPGTTGPVAEGGLSVAGESGGLSSPDPDPSPH